MSNEGTHSFTPKDGFVPDRETAIVIAEAVTRRIYGHTNIERQKPFQVSLQGEVWTIAGTLPSQKVGGTFEIQLSKIDGRVIRVTHGK